MGGDPCLSAGAARDRATGLASLEAARHQAVLALRLDDAQRGLSLQRHALGLQQEATKLQQLAAIGALLQAVALDLEAHASQQVRHKPAGGAVVRLKDPVRQHGSGYHGIR